MTQDGRLRQGSSGRPDRVHPVFKGARPDSDTPDIRGVMVSRMSLTAPGTQSAAS
jgi:hypothetical protein